MARCRLLVGFPMMARSCDMDVFSGLARYLITVDSSLMARFAGMVYFDSLAFMVSQRTPQPVRRLGVHGLAKVYAVMFQHVR